MLILMTIILLVIGTAVMMNIYSIFNPFVKTLGDIKNYNIAYYGAVGGIERAQLILKYHEPGFFGSGGWVGTENYGPSCDAKPNTLGTINGILWTIDSRADSIPQVGGGDIDLQLRDTDSQDYNKLEYNKALEFALDIDNTSDTSTLTQQRIDDYYYAPLDSSNILRFNSEAPNSIVGIFRLPPKIGKKFSGSSFVQNLSDGLEDIDGDGINNDIIITWSLFGTKDGGADDGRQFTVLPNLDVDYASSSVGNQDTAIRESIINGYSAGIDNIVFGSSKKSPTSTAGPADQYIIPTDSSLIGENFNGILQNSYGTKIKFSLVNIMKTSAGNNIYPFLEYKLQFLDFSNNPITVPSRFYDIVGEATVGDYNVKIRISKPTTESSTSSDFTVIF